MQPADIVRHDQLADLVCHDDQMVIWADEVRAELMDHLVMPSDYEGVLALDRAVRSAIRHVVEGAFSHPEVLGVESR